MTTCIGEELVIDGGLVVCLTSYEDFNGMVSTELGKFCLCSGGLAINDLQLCEKNILGVCCTKRIALILVCLEDVFDTGVNLISETIECTIGEVLVGTSYIFQVDGVFQVHAGGIVRACYIVLEYILEVGLLAFGGRGDCLEVTIVVLSGCCAKLTVWLPPSSSVSVERREVVTPVLHDVS